MPTNNKRNTAQRDRDRARIRAMQPACYLCGQPIDFTLPHTDPLSFVVDHVIPIAKGGSDVLANKKAAHRRRLQQQEACTHHPQRHPAQRQPRLGPVGGYPAHTHAAAPPVKAAVTHGESCRISEASGDPWAGTPPTPLLRASGYWRRLPLPEKRVWGSWS